MEQIRGDKEHNAAEKVLRILRAMNLRTRLLLAAIILLWLGAGIQAVMNGITYREENIAEAFMQINAGLAKSSQMVESSLMVLAECPDGFADNEARVRALHEIAEGIGLVIDGAIEKRETSDRTELSYSKNGKYAQTILKSIALNGTSKITDYVLLRLTIYQDMDNILRYRELAEELCEKAGYELVQVRLSLIGSYEGNLSIAERDQVTAQLLATLSGTPAYESRKEEDYTIYAYTPGISEYVISAGKKINVQIMMEYDPEKDRTKVIVASPVAG